MNVCAKGASGGYAPLGAVIASDEVHRAFREGSGKFAHGFTYGGNPVAAAAGAAVLEYIKKNDLVRAARDRGLYLMSGLQRIAASSEIIGDVRGLGLMTGIEFVADRETREPFPHEMGITEMVRSTAFANGLILYPAGGCADGVRGDAVMIAPPLVVNDAQIDEMLAILEQVVHEVERRVRRRPG
jgi:adenosylmethionine-8-amino-7-oxononanoate aminotransferase